MVRIIPFRLDESVKNRATKPKPAQEEDGDGSVRVSSTFNTYLNVIVSAENAGKPKGSQDKVSKQQIVEAALIAHDIKKRYLAALKRLAELG